MLSSKGLIIQALLDSKSRGVLSGQALAQRLKMSRAAVWKHVRSMRSAGYKITGSSRVGYRMISSPDKLYPELVRPRLETRALGRQVIHFDRIGSTQDEAKRLASRGGVHGAVIVAEAQSAGRGRFDRRWISPEGGLWFSVILRTRIRPAEILLVTQAAALAVAEAIESAANVCAAGSRSSRRGRISCAIKWPNDVLIDGKKVCGVLTELSAQADQAEWVAVGIGVNVNNAVPPGMKNIACSLAGLADRPAWRHRLDRAALLAGILLHLEKWTGRILSGDRVELIRLLNSRSSVIGRNMRVSGAGGIGGDVTGFVSGTADHIDNSGALVLRTGHGNVKIISGILSAG